MDASLRKVGQNKGARRRSELHKVFGAVAQLGEQLPCKQQVVGSIPISSTILNPSVG